MSEGKRTFAHLKEKDENGNEIEKSDGFTLSPIAEWAREYRTKDGGDLISGFFAWAGTGGSGDSPISRSEIPPELNWYDIKDFVNKQSLRLDRGEAGTDDKKGKVRYRERKSSCAGIRQLNCLTAICAKV